MLLKWILYGSTQYNMHAFVTCSIKDISFLSNYSKIKSCLRPTGFRANRACLLPLYSLSWRTSANTKEKGPLLAGKPRVKETAHEYSYKATFWWRSYVKKRYILNVWEPIPLKPNRELGQCWKCSKVVFNLIHCASLRFYELPKLRFCKMRLRVQVFSSWRRQRFLILPLIDQLKPLLCHNRSRL